MPIAVFHIPMVRMPATCVSVLSARDNGLTQTPQKTPTTVQRKKNPMANV